MGARGHAGESTALRRPPRAFAAALALVLAILPGAAFAADPAALLAGTRDALRDLRFAEAESLATLARDAIAPAARTDTLALAEAWYGIAESRARRRLLADTLALHGARTSLALYERAGAARSAGAADAHETLGEVLMLARRSAEGLEHVRRGLAIRRERFREPHAKIALSLERLGTIFRVLGEPDSALAALAPALAMREALAEPRDRRIGNVKLEMGLAHEMKGEDDRAQAMLDEALATHQRQLGADDPMVASALSIAAGFYFRHGEIARVIEDLEHAHRILAATRPEDDIERLIVRGQLATARYTIGDAGRALRIFDEVIPRLSARMGSSTSVLNFQIVRSNALRALGDTASALDALVQLRQQLERDSVRTDRARLATVMFNEADLRHLHGEVDEPLALARRVQASIRANATVDRRLLVRSLILQYSVHLQRRAWGEMAAIEVEIESTLALNRHRDLTMDASLLWLRSHGLAARGLADSALVAAAAAARLDREALARDVGTLSDTQALLLAGTLSESLEHLLGLGVAGGAAAARTAWEELVRVRGLVRAEVVRRRRPPDDAGSEAGQAHAAWRAASRALARFEVAAAGAPRDSALEAEEATLRAAVDETERRLFRAYPAGLLQREADGVTLDAVLQALPPSSALVALARTRPREGAPRLAAFVARAGSSTVQALDLGEAAALEERIATWRGTLGETDATRRSDRACRAAGLAVRRALWDPIARAIGDATAIHVVEEAPAYGLPWSALPDGTDGWLADQAFVFTVIGAERSLLARPAATGRGALAFGGIDFDRADTLALAGAAEPALAAALRAPSDACAPGLPRLAPLPATDAEARAVAEALAALQRTQGEVVTRADGASATEAVFKQLAPGRRILHVATHGVAVEDTCGRAVASTRGVGGVVTLSTPAPRRPARTPAATPARVVPTAPSPWASRQQWLALAGANHARERRDENDGLLTAAEVATLDLRGVEWVVLSACRSGAGEAWLREGVLGMQRAFHLAGAHTVIASEWSVEDEATREWMTALYAARAAGALDAAAAMGEATRAVIAARRATGRSVHPFYWAAFTATRQ